MGSKVRAALWEASIALAKAKYGKLTEDDAKKYLEIVDNALEEPLRNCDVGTPKEQSERMSKFCREQYKNTDGVALCSGCQFHNIEGLDCQFAWSQMPYKSDDSDDLIVKNEEVRNGD